MIGPVFVDTDVLVYDRDERDARKHRSARAWLTALWERPGLGVLSGQVLSEFHWTVTRKLKPGLDDRHARRYIRTLFAWEVVPIEQAAISEAWSVQDRYGFSFWGALIVAAARIGRCRVLLTEELQDGGDLDGLLVGSSAVSIPAITSPPTRSTSSTSTGWSGPSDSHPPPFDRSPAPPPPPRFRYGATQTR